MKRLLIIAAILTGSISAFAQSDSLALYESKAKKKLINDYSLIGVNYGVTFSNFYFMPSKYNMKPVFAPNYISITYTKHSKMFDSIPFFALVVGVATGTEGFEFTPDKESGYIEDADGAQLCTMRVIEAPAMMQIHFDADPFKLMANVGVYGGWRYSISRSGAGLDSAYEHSFRDYENRLDYGLQGGLGFALMFDPVELHFNCNVRWSWSSLYEPDYNSKYYYKYAYPLDIYASVGLHFQITRRRGKTIKDIKKEAYDLVYGTN
ncbi:MAG: hypothetical protein ACI3Y1_04560 [Candidatus Cryptobacteroides sp.]